MMVGDWAYCEELDTYFKILDRKVADEHAFLHLGGTVWVHEAMCSIVDTEECPRCGEQSPDGRRMRYSAGIYAGRMCDDCARSGYRDRCGLDGMPMLTQADCDEPIEEDY